MAIFDLLISFTKKNQESLHKFKKCVSNVLNLNNININLNLIYEYISYEQSKMVDFKCTEYFINNEISSSFLMIPNIEYFFIKVISVLNQEYLKKFVTVSILEYSSKISLIYSERLVVYNLDIDMFYIKYLTDNFFKDKYYRYSTIHIFNLSNVFSKLDKIRFKNKMIDYLNKTNDEEDFINIFEMYMMLILKEKQNKKIQYLDYIPKEVIEDNNDNYKLRNDFNLDNDKLRNDELRNDNLRNGFNLDNRLNDKLNNKVEYNNNKKDINCIINDNKLNNKKDINLINNDTNSINNDINCINFENINKMNQHKEEEIKNLDLKNKKINLYKNILKINIIKNIDKRIIEEFINIFENKNDHIEFLKYLMITYPHIVGEFMGSDYQIISEWCIKDIYNIICSKRNKIKDIKYKPIKINKYKGNLFQKLIDLKIRDDEIFLFGYVSNRELFFKKFIYIDSLMKDNLFFYGTLMNYILNKN